MPKQTSSLNISYEPIPDKDSSSETTPDDETTPNNYSPKQPFLDKGARKLISIIIGLFILIGVIFSFFMSQRDAYFQNVMDERDRTSVGVYQTSQTYYSQDRLSDMRQEDFKSRGLLFPSRPFAFVGDSSPCSGVHSMSDLNLDGAGCVDGLTVDVPQAILHINTSKTFQKIVGFGGAFTEAAAHNFHKLSATAQAKFLEAYFGEEGIAYTLGRIHINSCDFSLESYNFNDVKDDFKMEHFDHDVKHDQQEIIPFLRKALAATAFPLRLLASPWSPPGWMKVPSPAIAEKLEPMTMTGTSNPNGLIASPEVMSAWALYISYFIDAYASHEIPIWAVTPQNEPEFAAPWEACTYNASFERDFIDGYLGPQLQKAHPEIKILAFDHNKDHLVDWTKAMMTEIQSGKQSGAQPARVMSPYVDGMAFHWYYGGTGDRMLDGTYGYDAVEQSHTLMQNRVVVETDSLGVSSDSIDERSSRFRHAKQKKETIDSKILLATEGCSCPGVKLNSWFRAERLGHDIMFDLNSYAQGWIDWNLLVDHTGGPNHLGNLCDAPIIASEDFNHIHFQPEYFYIGHFSKFIPPESVRVQSSIVGNFNYQTSIHPDVHEGIELGVFPCEHSSRQMWKWRVSPKNPDFGYLQLLVSVVSDEESPEEARRQLRVDENDVSTFRCMGKGDDNRNFLRLWDCFPPALDTEEHQKPQDDSDAAVTALLESRRLSLRKEKVMLKSGEGDVFRLIEESSASSHAKVCVTVSPRATANGIQSGDLLSLVKCETDQSNGSESSIIQKEQLLRQLWKWNKGTGEMIPYISVEAAPFHGKKKSHASHVIHPFCLTAGWPFLTAVSFTTPNQQTVVTIMNEYPSDTYVLLKDENKGSMWTALNGKSIQTITF